MSACASRQRLFFGGIGGAYVYDGLSAAAKNPLLADTEPIVAALYNDHFGTLVTASGSTIKCWSADTGVTQQIYRRCTDSAITALAFDNSQKKILVGDANGTIRILNGLNGSVMKESDVGHGSR
jgi:WD40 repeat protein